MGFLNINNVKISGIAACVPKKIEENESLPVLGKEGAAIFFSTTGVKQRRITDSNTCASDLCFHAAEKLIASLKWNKEDIDALIFVTQTPDYILPATSCSLQHRLGLSQGCYTLDVSLGCSGWIYGLSAISSLLSSSGLKKGLLLAGDTNSKICSKEDKSTYPLFGDAGTATAVEWSTGSKMDFHVGCNGEGFEAIIIPDGAYRNVVTQGSLIPVQIEEGITRNKIQVVLDGMNVFSFGISQAPESVNNLISHLGIDIEKVDYFLFHQANMFMNEKIRKKLKLPKEKVPYSLEQFGNTSPASIPLTVVSQLENILPYSKKGILACGFGVGLSWGSVYFEADHILCPTLIEL